MIDDVAPVGAEALASTPIETLRQQRAEALDAEVRLSYLRRVAQGRLDIVHAELDCRRRGAPSAPCDVVEALRETLSSHLTSAGPGRLPQVLAPDVGDPELTAELDAIAPASKLTAIDGLDDEAVRSLEVALVDYERRVSADRHALHERIDAFQREIVRRYKEGEASVDSLLA